MEQALRQLLLAGDIGEELLDSESSELLQEVKYLREKNLQRKEALEDASRRKIMLEKEVSHMQEMLKLLQDLAQSYKNDVEIEQQTQKQISMQMEGHLRHQNMNADQLQQLQNSISQLQHQILVREKDIGELQKDSNVDSHLAQEILDLLGSEEEQNLLILRYMAEESTEMKKLSVELEKLSNEVSKAEQHYRECTNEAKACKTVRAHLVTSFLKEAQRRDELLLLWEQTVDDLKEKNEKETELMEDMLRAMSQISNLRQLRDREEQLLTQINTSAKEIQLQLENYEKESENNSFKISSLGEALYEMSGQVSELETNLSKLQAETSQLETQTKTTAALCQEKTSLLEHLETKCLKLESDIQLENELLLSSGQSLRAMETIKTELEKRNILFARQVKVIKNLKQRHLREIFDLRQKEKIEKGLINAMEATRLRTLKDMNDIRKKMMKSDQLIYSQELEMEEIKTRIHQLTHDDNNNPLTEDVRNNVEDLRQRISTINQNIQLLRRTIPLLQSSHTTATKELQTEETIVARLHEKATLLVLECEKCEKDKHRLTNVREEQLVEATLTEIHFQNRIKKLQDIQEQIKKIKETQNEMAELLKEERKGLRGAIAATRTQLRELEGRKASLAKQLHDTLTKMEQTKEKFNRIRISINAEEDDVDISPIYVMLEMAKEREGLQEAGDVLDMEVRKAECEVEGLQKILALLNMENDQFRSNLHHVAYHNEEDVEKSELENKLRTTEESLKTWNQFLQQESDELAREKEHLREIKLQLHAVDELLHEKNIHVRTVQRESDAQQIKIRHANQACHALRIKLNHKKLKLKDIELRIIQERLKVVNTIIGEGVSSHPDIADACILYCQQENVPPPKFSTLTKRSDYGSRSSLGSIASSKGNDVRKPQHLTGLNEAKDSRPFRSSMVSLNSQDSGSSSVASGVDEDFRSNSAASVISLSRFRSDSVIGKEEQEAKPENKTESLPKEEKRLHIMKPEFPSQISPLKKEFKGNRILKRPSFRN